MELRTRSSLLPAPQEVVRRASTEELESGGRKTRDRRFLFGGLFAILAMRTETLPCYLPDGYGGWDQIIRCATRVKGPGEYAG